MEIFIPGALYYHADEIYIKSKLLDNGIPEEVAGMISLTDYRLSSASKILIENILEEHGLLYRSASRMIENFQKGKTTVFASLHIENPSPVLISSHWEPCANGMRTYFRYGYERIQVNLWLRRIWQECQLLGLTIKKIEDVEFCRIKEFDFLGIAAWDSRKKEIDMIPFIITEVSVMK